MKTNEKQLLKVIMFSYSGMSPVQALVSIANGDRLPKPVSLESSPPLYELMLQCWDISPHKRPCFSDLKDHLNTYYSALSTQTLVLHPKLSLNPST